MIRPTQLIHVFNNVRGKPTPKNFLRQMKPNHGNYAWMPNTHPAHRVAPYEKPSFFVNAMQTGLGMVGRPSDLVDSLTSNAQSMSGIQEITGAADQMSQVVHIRRQRRLLR